MPDLTGESILGLVGSLYDQALESSNDGWQNIYLKIASLFESGPGGIVLRNEECDRFSIVAGTTTAESIQEYADHYQFISPFREIIRSMPVGASFLRSNTMSDDAFVRTEFYNDYLRKIEIFDYFYFPLVRSKGVTAGFSLSRPKSRPPFTSVENRAMAILAPHLKRAFEVYLNLANIHNENRTIMTALRSMQQGVIVVDKDRKMTFASERAEHGLRAKDGLEIAHGGTLRACCSNDDRRLTELLGGIFSPSLENVANHGGALQISRPGVFRPLQLRVTPYSARTFFDVESEDMAMIFVHDPDKHVETQENILIQLYSLTNAEAHIAALLADGKSTEEVCSILHVSDNTVRTHLKRIFSKTGTHRQSELVKLLVNGLANLGIDE